MTSRLLALGAALLATLTLGCQNPINQKTAARYYEAGLEHSGAGAHTHAVTLFERAVMNSRLGGSPAAGQAMALYGYGRELALIGETGEAIAALEESLRLQRTVEPPALPELLRRLSVLGRIELDAGDPAKAVKHLTELIDLVADTEIEEAYPGDILELHRNLRDAATAARDAVRLEQVELRIADFIRRHGDAPPESRYERFTPEATAERLAQDRSRGPEDDDSSIQ